MRYGFAIDQRTCIGCHACTVACKTEHQIPVGQFRTWVKYVDKGEWPASTRAFGVMRCNHCTDAPCVKICPTQALFKRDDGIVDFDKDRCIGCKSCMQGCPYDAIYIDEDTHTAAKCNYCAHRVDDGLEPACVVVCPTHSIWAGDLDDPTSGVARLVATNPTAVRSPEQDTGPNVFYLGADRAVLDPTLAPVDGSYLWAEPDAQRRAVAAEFAPDAVSGAKTTLNTAHPRPWGWRVTTYLWTKGVGSGALLVTSGALLAGIPPMGVLRLAAPAVAVGFTAVTGGLLVWDLKRPERFLYIFTKPNPSSWLFWGSVCLAGYSAVGGTWLAAALADSAGLLGPAGFARVVGSLRWAAIPTAVAAAGYTAFLFAQAEGRDLWQSKMLLPHLVVQAVQGGSGVLLALSAVTGGPPAVTRMLAGTFVAASAANTASLALEYGTGHETKQAAAAARMITHGRYRKLFWAGVVGVGGLAATLAVPGIKGRHLRRAALGGLLGQASLIAYESVFVRAGQDVPLS
ncbi:4Fe-4S dicluster domain-containing protein [Acidiferrimicrobium sp. IK]|uniref:4Fe-4S dicluster domain-containing protein n=1 Tax=Acidiferrimicrobium sp. IK TaxID=2871700 RepID=UPI0021CAE615|nr:4Fe-4S dicluster domain-containing protein [Acidiferrimicrobium sp. IK]